MGKKVSLATTIVICVIIAVIAFLAAWSATSAQYQKSLSEIYASKDESLTDKLSAIDSYYDSYYIGDIDEAVLENSLLKGYISGTGDKYGYYYTKEEYESLMQENSGTLTGVGIIVNTSKLDTVGIIVSRVIPSSPAENSGLKAGDIIVSVDGYTTIGADYDIVASKIRGEVGTNVELVIKRGDETIPTTVKRAVVEMESVIYDYIAESKIGFIRILTFDNTTSGQFKTAINSLKESGAEKFIFDLRGNGGGALTAIIGVCESLLPKGSLVTTAVFNDGKETEYKTSEGVEFNYPCAVLTDEHTASAAELFTAVVKEKLGGISVGSKTYGKGVMQQFISLPDKSAIKLTTAYYNTPNGVNYNGVGIYPETQATLAEGYTIDYYSLDITDAVISAAIEALNK